MLADACGRTNAARIYSFENKDNMMIHATAPCVAKVENDCMARAPRIFTDIERFLREMPDVTAKRHGKKCQVQASPKDRAYGKVLFKGVDVRYRKCAPLL